MSKFDIHLSLGHGYLRREHDNPQLYEPFVKMLRNKQKDFKVKLEAYRKKRNFTKTQEPKGQNKSLTNKNCYVIQKHAASHLHYDFRIELNGVLKSWAVPKGPCLDPKIKRLAVHVEDHPLEYAEFEGIIPKGQYGGGAVMIWDNGEWICEDDDPPSSYQKGSLTFRLMGIKLKGLWKLISIKKTLNHWLLIKIQDRYAKGLKDYDITIKKPKSVISGLSMQEIAKKYQYPQANNIKNKPSQSIKNKIFLTNRKRETNFKLPVAARKTRMFAEIRPQLASLVSQPPSGPEWLHEIKFDGYRIVAFIKNQSVRLMTRHNKDWTAKFLTVAEALKEIPIKSAILDGEVVVLDEAERSDFQLLQNSINRVSGKPFIYYVFDILYYNGHELTQIPLIERKRLLHRLIPNAENSILRYSDHIFDSGPDVFTKACDLGLEGIVSKNINGQYIQKRGTSWLKAKCSQRQEFVILGYTLPRGSRRYFGSLLLGLYSSHKKLLYCGLVGTGFNEHTLKSLYTKLNLYQTEHMPLAKKPRISQKVIWVKPQLVAQVEFIEWTKDGLLRHPSFKGLREDKNPFTVESEKILPQKKIDKLTHPKKIQTRNMIRKYHFKITHPEKLYFKEQNISKLDLIDYYQNVHSWAMPYLKNRPLTILRCPNGYHLKCFYQKHIHNPLPKTLHLIPIQEKSKTEKYIYINGEEGLLTLAQLGCLELHTWGCHIDSIDTPDTLIFDLDPAPDVAWKSVVAAALELKTDLRHLKLRAFAKTTGGKGLHVVVPIRAEHSWDTIKNLSRFITNILVMQDPSKYIGQMAKAKRSGKIYIDYLRNQRGATAIAPYSTRANQYATIATPIAWDELTNDIRDTTFTLKTLPARLHTLKEDPWNDFLHLKQRLILP